MCLSDFEAASAVPGKWKVKMPMQCRRKGETKTRKRGKTQIIKRGKITDKEKDKAKD